MRRWRAFGRPVSALMVVGILGVVAAGSMIRVPAASGQSKQAARTSAPAKTMPDTVLARVGTNRRVTRSEFMQAWERVEPPVRPESLTPQTAREFLDLLIGKEALGEAALAETWEWSLKDSAEYGGLRDGLIMKVVLDSALNHVQQERLAEGHDTLSVQELGTVARDVTLSRMKVTFDDAMVERLRAAWEALPVAPRDSGVFAALRALGRDPAIAEDDLPKVVANYDGRPYRTSDLMDYWRRLNPLNRPRVTLPGQIKDLVSNGIFEHVLREQAERRKIDAWPEIARQLHTQKELIAVTHLVDREVYQKIPLDSVFLARYYLEHEEVWHLPPRARLLRMIFPDRSQAADMALKLRDRAEVDSLIKLAQKAGVSYYAEYSAETDSAVFATAMRLGEDAVMGPDSTARGWAVARVMEILPGSPRPYSEVRDLVRHAVYGDQGERLMRELLQRVRSRVRVTVNERALERIGSG